MTWGAVVTGQDHNAMNVRSSIAPKVRPNVSTATRSTASSAVVVRVGRVASDYAGIVPIYVSAPQHFAQSMFKYVTSVKVVPVPTAWSPGLSVIKN
jgi:hypothetical protein